jgi:hypothetical protein
MSDDHYDAYLFSLDTDQVKYGFSAVGKCIQCGARLGNDNLCPNLHEDDGIKERFNND